MRVTRRGVAVLVLAGVLAGAGIGRASSSGSVPELEGHPATVRCAGMAEDSAAHVRLVTFERSSDGLELVYRCERRGGTDGRVRDVRRPTNQDRDL